MSKSSISRRGFISGAVASTLAARAVRAADSRLPEGLPTRVLGRTGERVSMLALGCGSRLLMYEKQDKGVEVVDLAIKSGITYLDTAQSYGRGKSESWIEDSRITWTCELDVFNGIFQDHDGLRESNRRARQLKVAPASSDSGFKPSSCRLRNAPNPVPCFLASSEKLMMSPRPSLTFR